MESVYTKGDFNSTREKMDYNLNALHLTKNKFQMG